MTYNNLRVLNDHLESGTISDNNQISLACKKELVFKGYLINLFNRDNLTCSGYTVLTKKGFKKIMRYRKLFLVWSILRKLKWNLKK